MKDRYIEMYIGIGGDNGTWDTEYVPIPIDTPDDAIDSIAISITKELYKNISFTGVYSIPELEDEIND